MHALRAQLRLTCAKLFAPASEQNVSAMSFASERVGSTGRVLVARCVLRHAARKCTTSLHSIDIAIEHSCCAAPPAGRSRAPRERRAGRTSCQENVRSLASAKKYRPALYVKVDRYCA